MCKEKLLKATSYTFCHTFIGNNGARTGRRPPLSVSFWFYPICHMNFSKFICNKIEVSGKKLISVK